MNIFLLPSPWAKSKGSSSKKVKTRSKTRSKTRYFENYLQATKQNHNPNTTIVLITNFTPALKLKTYKNNEKTEWQRSASWAFWRTAWGAERCFEVVFKFLIFRQWFFCFRHPERSRRVDQAKKKNYDVASKQRYLINCF